MPLNYLTFLVLYLCIKQPGNYMLFSKENPLWSGKEMPAGRPSPSVEDSWSDVPRGSLLTQELNGLCSWVFPDPWGSASGVRGGQWSCRGSAQTGLCVVHLWWKNRKPVPWVYTDYSRFKVTVLEVERELLFPFGSQTFFSVGSLVKSLYAEYLKRQRACLVPVMAREPVMVSSPITHEFVSLDYLWR